MSELSAKQKQCVQILAIGGSVAATARHLGIGERTVRRWKQDERFAQALHEAEVELLGQGHARLASTYFQSVDALYRIGQDAFAPASARVAALGKLIDAVQRSVVLERLQAEMAELQKQLEDLTYGPHAPYADTIQPGDPDTPSTPDVGSDPTGAPTPAGTDEP